ncbi:transmembrane amino acid transporter protein-domain-containing protein [Pilobolus umbonatus]|nr:transmembrane amino acid transporter protein-domain-containing protein [Pilobolus umbonatus]
MGASLNLVNAMMGTGIIGLPLALHLCGFWVGLISAIVIAYMTCMTMHITILCGLKTRTNSLVSLCNVTVGRVGSQIINIILIFHTAGTAVSYYILLGDTLPGLLVLIFPNVSVLANRKFVIVMFGLCFTLPLSLARSSARFTKWSALSVVLLAIMLIGVLVRIPYYVSPNIELEVFDISEQMFKGFAIMGLAFCCSQNLFGVFTSTKEQGSSRWFMSCSMAVLIAFVINMTFAISAYICFGKDVQANVLLNFPENDPGIRVVKLTLGLFMVLTIPYVKHTCVFQR